LPKILIDQKTPKLERKIGTTWNTQNFSYFCLTKFKNNLHAILTTGLVHVQVGWIFEFVKAILAMLRLFSWPPLPTRVVSVRIKLFGYILLDYPIVRFQKYYEFDKLKT
jgi:hypothetical protein